MTPRTIDSESISAIVNQYGARPEMLVQILQRIVQQHGWISEDVTRQLAGDLNLSRADVHGVVEYYHDFRTKPPGKHIVKICQAEACQSMGSRDLVAHADRVTDGETTVEAAYCLGNCACAPAVMIDGKTYGRVDADRYDALLQTARESRT